MKKNLTAEILRAARAGKCSMSLSARRDGRSSAAGVITAAEMICSSPKGKEETVFYYC